MPQLDFDYRDVEATADKKKPWTRRVEFGDEIKPEDMADTAAVYARAAGEAGNAGELATQATEVAAEAGDLDGAPLIAPGDRIDETARGLQGNGQDIDAVVGLIVGSMNRAIEAVDEVNMVIDEPQNGLDAQLRRHQQDAVDEWNAWVALRNERIGSRVTINGHEPLGFGPPLPMVLEHDGQSLTLEAVRTGPLTYSWEQLPDSLADRIRTKHIAAVAEAAKAADERITHLVAGYRADLMRFAGELGDLGYDLDGGPFALWTSDEMADFAAERLHEELGRDSPDPHVVTMYTEGLAAILDGIVAEDGDLVPGARLTDAQRHYLETVLGGLTADDLAALGRFEPGTGLGNPMAAGEQNEVMERVANAINLLTDPAAGGYDVSDDAGWRKVPAGVRDMLTLARNTTDPSDPLVDHIGDWNAFGDLMAHADLAPSDGWGRRVAESAVEMQQTTMTQYLQSLVDDVEANTGSSDLLGMVAMNSGVSADLLNDRGFRENLLGSLWEDSSGAAELIDSGTTVPEGMHHNDPEARKYISAAYHFLEYSADHHDAVLGESRTYNDSRFDHTELQSVLGDTMLNYMDFISQVTKDSELGGIDAHLFGRDYDYSFNIGSDTRESLFQLMYDSDEDVRQRFFNGVGQWQSDRAAESFARTGDRLSETANFEAIGSVAGSAADVQANAGASDKSKQQFTAMGAIGTTASIVNTLADFGKGNALTSAAAFGAQELLRYHLPDGSAALKEAQWDLANNGDIPLRIAVADGALRANFGGVADEVDETTLAMMHEPGTYGWDDAEAAAKNIGGEYYEAYVNAMENGYNLATRNDLTAN